jgi:hypothetical protein
MMIRPNPIYLSVEVYRALRLLAKAKGTTTDDQGLGHITTADQMADELLRELLKEKYPLIAEHQRQVDKLEKELIKKLGGRT